MLSTLKFTTSTQMDKDSSKKVLTIWQSLQNSNDSVQFRMPVDWQGLGLVDYLTIIKNPMDLNTVHTKITQSQYRTIQQALDDLQLIWDNCKTYNRKGWLIYELAQKLQRLFKKLVKNHLPAVGIQPNNSKNSKNNKTDKTQKIQISQIELQEKMKFVQRIKGLRPQQLGLLVSKMQQLCPNSFRQTQQEKAQILVDQFDKETWKKLLDQLDLIQETSDTYQKRVKN